MIPNNKVHDIIENRFSPRAFDPRPVEKEKLYRIFEAARRAPSSFNEQPWRFIIGEKGRGTTWDLIYSVLNETNQKWTVNASVLGLIIGKSDFSKNNKPNKHKFYDCGQAAAYMTFQATAEGICVHQMAGFSSKKSIEVFHIPDGFEPITAFALGYLGAIGLLPDQLKKAEEKEINRKDLSEIVFSGWGEGFKF